jgi:hypothetical protein
LTPAATSPLHENQDGPAFDESWQYDSVIGMMMYMGNNACPDIANAVHQAARFTHHPRESHAVGIKRISRHLKRTKMEGIFISPQNS